jgi:hypothetical protein
MAQKTPSRRRERADEQTLIALRQFDDLPDTAFVRTPVVRVLCGNISDDEVVRRVRAGQLPAPTKFGERHNIFQVGGIRRALARMLSEARPPRAEPKPPPVAPPVREGRRRHAEGLR